MLQALCSFVNFDLKKKKLGFQYANSCNALTSLYYCSIQDDTGFDHFKGLIPITGILSEVIHIWSFYYLTMELHSNHQQGHIYFMQPVLMSNPVQETSTLKVGHLLWSPNITQQNSLLERSTQDIQNLVCGSLIGWTPLPVPPTRSANWYTQVTMQTNDRLHVVSSQERAFLGPLFIFHQTRRKPSSPECFPWGELALESCISS